MARAADTTKDRMLTRPDGRVVGFAEHGEPGGRPVLWCHGGPGSRLEPAAFVPAAADAVLRVVGVDRPGYGLSTARPGRSIADWVADGLAVVDGVGIDEFAVVGVSTGGAYALALAAAAPGRVTGVVACCALTDMSWADGRATMPRAGVADLWDAPDRDAALARAADAFGEDGSRRRPWSCTAPPTRSCRSPTPITPRRSCPARPCGSSRTWGTSASCPSSSPPSGRWADRAADR
jgi:pimeloyl-ACP methyl ester carboxylesterase